MSWTLDQLEEALRMEKVYAPINEEHAIEKKAKIADLEKQIVAKKNH